MGGLKPTVSPGGGALGQQAFASQTGVGNSLKQTGSDLTGMGTSQLRQSGNYFSTLASGNRAATAQALAPAVGNINSVYGGTARTLDRFTRGPDKTVQMAETERERAGQVSSLFRDAPANANANLASMGAGTTAMGLGATAGAGSIFGSQATLAQNAQISQNQQQEQAGQDFGGLIFNAIKYAAPAVAAPFTGGASLALYGIPGYLSSGKSSSSGMPPPTSGAF